MVAFLIDLDSELLVFTNRFGGGTHDHLISAGHVFTVPGFESNGTVIILNDSEFLPWAPNFSVCSHVDSISFVHGSNLVPVGVHQEFLVTFSGSPSSLLALLGGNSPESVGDSELFVSLLVFVVLENGGFVDVDSGALSPAINLGNSDLFDLLPVELASFHSVWVANMMGIVRDQVNSRFTLASTEEGTVLDGLTVHSVESISINSLDVVFPGLTFKDVIESFWVWNPMELSIVDN